MARYMKNKFLFYGIPASKRKEVYKGILKREKNQKRINWELLDKCYQDEYREMLPKEGDDANAFSSGRIHIWQTYAKGFNFIGNSADAATPISPEIYQRTAHNSTVEITKR